jgi:hypothetical protein
MKLKYIKTSYTSQTNISFCKTSTLHENMVAKIGRGGISALTFYRYIT